MPEQPSPLELYVSGFRDRVLATRSPGQEMLDAPGILGLVGSDPVVCDGRVLVTDDRALDLLVERLPQLRARVVIVLAGAERCRAVVEEIEGYRVESATAMVCDDLRRVPQPHLVEGLSLCSVDAKGDGGRVPIAEAAAAALSSVDPSGDPPDDLDRFVSYLRLTPDAQFFAAVDDQGAVRATSASTNFGDAAGVFFVSTHPDWRGCGVGTAMTATALRAAAASGARRACLDSSDLGLSIYRRLGFTAAGPLTLHMLW